MAQFGESYQHYHRRIPMLMPRLRGGPWVDRDQAP
jgi:protein-S-isoprenylcysteine O-methyltransferase Ste14